MREYETVIVLHPTYDEKEFEAEIQAVSDMITASGGSVLEIDRWGRRRLAYEINKVHEGIYTLLRYSSDAAVLKEMERRFRMNERMLRYMTVISEGPLAPARAEGGPESAVTAERKSHQGPAGTPVPAEAAAPAGITASSDLPASTEAPTTEPPRVGDTPADPADGSSL